jgi:Flp pilus assembly protein TadB
VRRPPTGGRSQPASRGAGPTVRRADRVPTWGASFRRAGVSAAILLAVFVLVLDQAVGVALGFALFAFLFYAPLFYLSDRLMYRRRQRRKQRDVGSREGGH